MHAKLGRIVRAAYLLRNGSGALRGRPGSVGEVSGLFFPLEVDDAIVERSGGDRLDRVDQRGAS